MKIKFSHLYLYRTCLSYSKSFAYLKVPVIFFHVTSKSFIVLGLKFSFAIHFNFYYVFYEAQSTPVATM